MMKIEIMCVRNSIIKRYRSQQIIPNNNLLNSRQTEGVVHIHGRIRPKSVVPFLFFFNIGGNKLSSAFATCCVAVVIVVVD